MSGFGGLLTVALLVTLLLSVVVAIQRWIKAFRRADWRGNWTVVEGVGDDDSGGEGIPMQDTR